MLPAGAGSARAQASERDKCGGSRRVGVENKNVSARRDERRRMRSVQCRASLSGVSLHVHIGNGQMGSALMGSLQISCFLTDGFLGYSR